MKKLGFALITLAGLPALAVAQEARVPGSERKLTIFEGDACPPDTICVVAPSDERYRIPKPLRQGRPSLENQSWTVRSQDTLDLGRSGIDSCSNVGEAGWTGCFQKAVRENRRIIEEEKANARKIP